MNNKIKPCLSCGSKDIDLKFYDENPDWNDYVCTCNGCGKIHSTPTNGGESGIVGWWNRVNDFETEYLKLKGYIKSLRETIERTESDIDDLCERFPHEAGRIYEKLNTKF